MKAPAGTLTISLECLKALQRNGGSSAGPTQDASIKAGHKAGENPGVVQEKQQHAWHVMMILHGPAVAGTLTGVKEKLDYIKAAMSIIST